MVQALDALVTINISEIRSNGFKPSFEHIFKYLSQYKHLRDIHEPYSSLNQFQPTVAFHIETSNFNLRLNSNEWFLYDMQCWDKMG